MNEIQLTVPDISCQHCITAITGEVGGVAGVTNVLVDLDARSVRVRGGAMDFDAVYAAVVEAGYEPQI